MRNKLYSLVNTLKRTLQRLFGFPTLGVKAIVIEKSGKILLVEHTYVAGWHLPGGGVSFHETPKKAICRELKEEANIFVKGDPVLFAIYTHEIKGAPDYPILYLIHDFTIQPHTPCAEIKQIGWFAPDNLPTGTTENTQQRIKEVLNKLPVQEHW